MLGTVLRRNMSQKLSVLLLLCGLLWGLMLLRYTFQHRPIGRESSAQLRLQILELSHRYVRALTEENRIASGPQGPAMAGQADLKRTIAILLDDILQRLGKLEGKLDAAINGSLANATHPTGGMGPANPAPPPQPIPVQDTPSRQSEPRQPAVEMPKRRLETASHQKPNAGKR
ncbi:hypothetical protein GJAV_G00106550 [Gymnothorax javanicus]|nr:hypothetical protein GJAV_G00106550 [Gymnothorax javanicus]